MKKLTLLLVLLWNAVIAFSQTPELENRINACHNEIITLDAGAYFRSYRWNTGDTTQTISVKEKGWYIVTVTDTLNTILKDSCYVHYLDFKVLPENQVIYCHDSIILSITPDTLQCVWKDFGITSDTLVVKPNKTMQYRVTVTDGYSFCTDTVTVTVIPPFKVAMNQIFEGCMDTCDGQFRAVVTGGTPPYILLWDGLPARFDTIATGLCPGSHSFSVTDASLCGFDTTFTVEAYKALNATITSDPEKVYIQNPTVQLSFEIEGGEDDLEDWEWDFGDSTLVSKEREPIHIYTGVKKYYSANAKSYTVSLKLWNKNGCDTTITLEIPIEEIVFELPNALTPDRGSNNVFKIKDTCFYFYKQIELVVLTRYGKKVYESSNYHNDFTGKGLESGVYFLILRCHGYFREDVFKGSLTIFRD